MYVTILENQLEKITDNLLDYSNETSERIIKSVESFIREDSILSKDIIEKTTQINKKSEEIEYDCLKVLGLLQPVAKDLRLGAAILRTSTELERINLLSAYISRYSIDSLKKGSNFHKPIHITLMSHTVQNMLKDAVGSLLTGDVQLLKRSTKNFVSLQDFYNQMFAEYGDDNTSTSSTYSVLVARNLLSMGHHIMGMNDRIAYSIIGKRIMHHKVFYNVLMK